MGTHNRVTRGDTARVGLAFALAALVAPLGGGPSARAAGPADETPWLGVGIMDGAGCVRVIEVIRETPAEEAGLRVDDDICEVGGERVMTASDLTATVARYRVADEVALSVRRGRENLAVPVVLGPRLSLDQIMHRRLVGTFAPSFDLEIIHGSDSGARDLLRGRVVVLQFFHFGCQACIDQHGALSRLADEYRDDGLVIIAVNGDPEQQIVDRMLRSRPSFNVAYDPFGYVFRAFRVESEPALVVIDSESRVSYAGVGGAGNLARVKDSVERLLRRGRRAR